MPNYYVVVSGEGLTPPLDGDEPACRFRARCRVWASDPAVAANMAAQLVRAAPELLAKSRAFVKDAPVYIEEIHELPADSGPEAPCSFEFDSPRRDDGWPLTVNER